MRLSSVLPLGREPAEQGSDTARPDAGRDRLAKMYDEYAKRVFTFALRVSGDRTIAEDLLSETMLKAFAALGRGEAPESGVFYWLCAICVNTFRDLKRRERTRREFAERELVRPPDPAGSTVTIDGVLLIQAEADTYWDQVKTQIVQLPPPEKTCLLLKLGGYSYEEIAARCDFSPKEVKNAIQNAMRELRRTFRTSAGCEDE